MKDRIEIRGLSLLLHCGVLPEEQQRKQPIEFDLDLYLDLEKAATSDDLTQTVNYGAAIASLATLETERFRLLEHLAKHCTEILFTAYPIIDEITITVTKIRPPIANTLTSTGVKIHRKNPKL